MCVCVCGWVGLLIYIYKLYFASSFKLCVCVYFFPFLVNTFKEASHSHSHSHIQPTNTN